MINIFVENASFSLSIEVQFFSIQYQFTNDHSLAEHLDLYICTFILSSTVNHV